MKKNTIKYIGLAVAFVVPLVSYAALEGAMSLLIDIGTLIRYSLTVLFGLALAYFFWGLGRFIWNAGEQKARDEGKQRMIWGVVALFVFVSIYGIIAYIGILLGIPLNSGSPFQGGGAVPLPLYQSAANPGLPGTQSA